MEQNIFASPPAAAAEVYVCFLNPENHINKIFIFGKNAGAAAAGAEFNMSNFRFPASKMPLVDIIYSGQRIHKDDTISLIKNKIIRAARGGGGAAAPEEFLYEELYMFNEIPRRANWAKLYMDLAARGGGEAPGEDILRKLKENIPTLDIDPAVATYEDFVNLPETQYVRTPIGVKFVGGGGAAADLLFPANPYAAAAAAAAEKPPNTYIFENELLLNYLGSGGEAAGEPIVIYVCLAPAAAAEVLPPHYTLLSRAAGGTPIEQWKKNTLLQRREIDNTPIKDAVDIFYDIAATAATQQPPPEVLPDFIDSGITSFFIKIHPASTYTLPLETIFKILHTSETYPLIKFNPGTGRENLYRLHTDKVAQNGRKIPVLPRSEINNITRKVGKSRQIAIYVLAAGGATELYCTFDVNGDLSIQSGVFDRPLAMIEVDELIKTYIQPIINNVNENLSTAGYNIPNFVSLRDQNNSIEIINIDYVWYIPDKSQTATLNKQIEKFRPAFFSLFERIEFMKNIKNGLQLKYKRVGNYKPMEAQKALIADLFKKYGNVVQVLEELTTIYHLTKEDAAIAVAKYRDSINAVYDEKGKVRGALENPGFSTNIRFIQRNVKNIIVGFEMSGITSFHYIDVLQIYVRSFFMLFFYPKSIPEKIYKSLERTWGASKIEGAAVAAAVPVAAAENMVIFEPAAAAAAKPPVPEEEDAGEDIAEEAAAPPLVEDYDSEEMDDLLGLLGDESSDDDDDSSDEDESTTRPTSGGAPPVAEPDIEKQKQLLENKSLHPNPFSKKREELDKVLFRVPADKKNKTFTSYSRACPANIYRQPVALTDEEKANIDENYPGSYTKALKYGSDKEHMNWYICPRYWCLLTNTSMTYADIMAGRCGNSTKIIPKGEKKIPKDTFIYEFNDFGKEHLDKNGNYIDHFPGLTKQINETYKKYPCCFKTLDEDVDEAAADEAAAAAPTAAPEPAAAAIGYVLGSEKSPVPEGKWGYLPVVVQFFLQTNNTLCARVENPNTLKQNTPCMLRYGVESACFLACLAEIYGYKNKTKTPAVEEMRRVVAEKISGAQFAAAHGGELARIFGGEESFRDFIKNSGIYEIDYRYLWDIICSPGFLFEDGLNLVILNVPNNDITGNVEIICPTNSYSSVPLYDAQKETAIMIKSGKLYEPIYLYENRKDSVIIKKTFHPSTSTPALKKVLDTITYSTNRFCSPYPVIDFVRPIHIDEIVRRAPGWRINKNILNNQGNVIALEVVTAAAAGAEPRLQSGIIPCAPFQKPAAGAAVVSVNKVKWADYETTITFLRTFSRETGLPFTPIVKILEDGLITGVLTETNQFISIDSPTENNRGGDDGLKAINASNLILTESDFYNSAAPDEERIKTTKLISLESQFYQTFRSLARSIINKNLAERKHIAAILAEKITYREKLTRIQRELRDLMEGSVDFVKFTDKVLMSIDRVVSCALNCDEKYCLKTAGSDAPCKFLIPRNHLLHNSPNDVIYYARLADEIIRYKKIQTFIFNQNTFLNLSNIKYNILDNEIILLENNIKTGDYFENLVPEKYKITYSRATPAGAEINPFVFTLEDQGRRGRGAAVAAAAAAATSPTETAAAAPPPAQADLYKNIQNCIKETTERIKGNINSKWYRILPTRCGEVFFTNTAGICSFAPIIYIYQTIFNVYVSPNDIKQKLVEAYEAAADESAAMAAGIYNVMYKEGKRELSTKLRSGELTFERAIMSEDYYLTNIDLWMFFSSVKFPASIVLFTALKLKQIDEIMGEEIDWLLLNGAAAAGATPEKFFFIRSPTKYEINEPAQYSIVSPAIKLTETRGDFQDEFRGAAVEKTQIGDFLRAAAAAEPARRGRKRIIVMGK